LVFTSTPREAATPSYARIGKRGEKQTLTIQLHAELDPGTVRAIMRQAARYIPETELQPHFYSH